MSSIFGSDIPLPPKHTGVPNKTSTKVNKTLNVRQAVAGVRYRQHTHKDQVTGEEFVDKQELAGVACVDLVINGHDHRLCFKAKKDFGGDVTIRKMLVSVWKDAKFQDMLRKYAYNPENFKTIKALQAVKLQLGDGTVTTAGALWNDTMHKYGYMHLAPSNAKVTARHSQTSYEA